MSDLYICTGKGCSEYCYECCHGKPHEKVDDMIDTDTGLCTAWSECTESDKKVRCVKVKEG